MKKKVIKKSVKAKPQKKISKEIENKIGIIPLGDRVLVKPFDAGEMNQTASGIIIPDTVSKDKPERGEIVAVGKKVEAEVKVGDTVAFSRYGFEDIKVNGIEYYILKEESILAIIK